MNGEREVGRQSRGRRKEEGGGLGGKVLVVGALVLALALTGTYLASGGLSYTPEKSQNPCDPRPWRNPEGLNEIATQFSLSALDGAACKLGVSRETLARALATTKSREEFGRRYHIDDAKLSAAIQAGLVRAVDDAEEAGALSPILAGPVRTAVEHIPLDQAIELTKDAKSIFNSAEGFLGPVTGFLEELLP